jgi:hypothetical protein
MILRGYSTSTVLVVRDLRCCNLVNYSILANKNASPDF